MVFLNRLTFVLFPGRCILCQALTQRPLDLCLDCETDLPRIPFPCSQCGQEIPARAAQGYSTDNRVCGACLVNPPLYSRSLSAFAYIQPINQLIAEFKNGHQLLVGRVLAMVLAERYQARLGASADSRLAAGLATDEPRRPDLLIPMPLHPNRLKFRGFNQAREIAYALRDKTGIPIDDRLCERHLESPPQKGLTATQRRRNIERAFSLTRRLDGERLAIIDDVLTTRATVTELTRAALKAGASSIEVVTLARTPKPSLR